MWRRGEELLKTGLTYQMIAGRLASEFSLEEIPSDDTVRKQIRNLDTASGIRENLETQMTIRSGIEAQSWTICKRRYFPVAGQMLNGETGEG